MIIRIWNGCVLQQEIEVDAEGPNISLDPASRCGVIINLDEITVFNWRNDGELPFVPDEQ